MTCWSGFGSFLATSMCILILINPKGKYQKEMQKMYIGMAVHPLGLPQIPAMQFQTDPLST